MYFSTLGHIPYPKNKLQKEFISLMKKYERKVVHAIAAKAFIYRLTKEIECLNSKHPRCNPLEVEWSEERDGDWLLWAPWTGAVLELQKGESYEGN